MNSSMIDFEKLLGRIGQHVRTLRHRAGWTQEQASDKAGIPNRRYQSIEAGRANMTLKTLYRLARLFKKDPKALM
jgi:transcriptional regulator with XRE-family HTH domain